MAIQDFSEAFSQAWRPLDTLMRGRVALAEHDMTRREREADEAERRRFLLELDEKRDTRQRSHDAAMTDRQLAAIKAQNDEMFSRHEKASLEAAKAKAKGLGLPIAPDDKVGDLLFKINQHEEGRATRTYQAFQQKITRNNERANSMLNRMDEQKVRAATMEILSSGIVNNHLTDDQKRRLQAYVTPGLKNSDGTSVQPTSPMEILSEIGQSRWGAPGSPDKRVSAFGSAFSAALEKQSGKNDPRILEIQSLYEDNRRLIEGADKLLANPAVAESLLNTSEPKTETPQSDPAKAFLDLKPKASEGPVSPTKSAADQFSSNATNPFYEAPPQVTRTPEGGAIIRTPSFASRALGGAGRFLKGLVPDPGSMFLPNLAARTIAAPFRSSETTLSPEQAAAQFPSTPVVRGAVPDMPRAPQMIARPDGNGESFVPPEDIQGMQQLAAQDGFTEPQMRQVMAGVQAGDPAAVKTFSDYYQRYQEAKLQMSFGAGDVIPGINDAADFSSAYR